jgi:hypothetical protein
VCVFVQRILECDDWVFLTATETSSHCGWLSLVTNGAEECHQWCQAMDRSTERCRLQEWVPPGPAMQSYRYTVWDTIALSCVV